MVGTPSEPRNGGPQGKFVKVLQNFSVDQLLNLKRILDPQKDAGKLKAIEEALKTKGDSLPAVSPEPEKEAPVESVPEPEAEEPASPEKPKAAEEEAQQTSWKLSSSETFPRKEEEKQEEAPVEETSSPLQAPATSSDGSLEKNVETFFEEQKRYMVEEESAQPRVGFFSAACLLVAVVILITSFYLYACVYYSFPGKDYVLELMSSI